jgi:hypothetical protein
MQSIVSRGCEPSCDREYSRGLELMSRPRSVRIREPSAHFQEAVGPVRSRDRGAARRRHAAQVAAPPLPLPASPSADALLRWPSAPPEPHVVVAPPDPHCWENVSARVFLLSDPQAGVCLLPMPVPPDAPLPMTPLGLTPLGSPRTASPAPDSNRSPSPPASPPVIARLRRGRSGERWPPQAALPNGLPKVKINRINRIKRTKKNSYSIHRFNVFRRRIQSIRSIGSMQSIGST